MRSIEVRADLPNLERATAYDVNMIHQARFLRNFLIISYSSWNSSTILHSKLARIFLILFNIRMTLLDVLTE